jgi:SAM-dependent methyltransferase
VSNTQSDSATEDNAQARVNMEVWSSGNFVKEYASRDLRPAEIIMLVRHATAFTGQVLELGCGAGRLTGYLVDLADSVHGIDVSPAMIDYCRETYPGGTFSVEDLRDLSRFKSQSFDVVVGANNVIDVLGDSERRLVLREIGRILKPEGIVAISSHNRAYIPKLRKPTDLKARNFVRAVGKLVLMPWREHNRRRLVPLEHSESDYELVNDDAHHFRLLHYYISRTAQEHQLEEEGLRLIECLDGEGRAVPIEESAADWAELYYIAHLANATVR